MFRTRFRKANTKPAWLMSTRKLSPAEKEFKSQWLNLVKYLQAGYDTTLLAMPPHVLEGARVSFQGAVGSAVNRGGMQGAMDVRTTTRRKPEPGRHVRHPVKKAVATSVETQFSFDMTNPLVGDFVQNKTGDMITAIDAETRKGVQNIIQQSYFNGLTPAQASKMIQPAVGLTGRWADTLGRFGDGLMTTEGMNIEGHTLTAAGQAAYDKRAAQLLQQRGDLIARTEIVSAENAGRSLAWDQAIANGLISQTTHQKEWVTTGDDRTCDECEGMEGEQVGLDDSFSSGDDMPPTHPDCRCTAVLVETGDEVDTGGDLGQAAADMATMSDMLTGGAAGDLTGGIADDAYAQAANIWNTTTGWGEGDYQLGPQSVLDYLNDTTINEAQRAEALTKWGSNLNLDAGQVKPFFEKLIQEQAGAGDLLAGAKQKLTETMAANRQAAHELLDIIGTQGGSGGTTATAWSQFLDVTPDQVVSMLQELDVAPVSDVAALTDKLSAKTIDNMIEDVKNAKSTDNWWADLHPDTQDMFLEQTGLDQAEFLNTVDALVAQAPKTLEQAAYGNAPKVWDQWQKGILTADETIDEVIQQGVGPYKTLGNLVNEINTEWGDFANYAASPEAQDFFAYLADSSAGKFDVFQVKTYVEMAVNSASGIVPDVTSQLWEGKGFTTASDFLASKPEWFNLSGVSDLAKNPDWVHEIIDSGKFAEMKQAYGLDTAGQLWDVFSAAVQEQGGAAAEQSGAAAAARGAATLTDDQVMSALKDAGWGENNPASIMTIINNQGGFEQWMSSQTNVDEVAQALGMSGDDAVAAIDAWAGIVPEAPIAPLQILPPSEDKLIGTYYGKPVPTEVWDPAEHGYNSMTEMLQDHPGDLLDRLQQAITTNGGSIDDTFNALYHTNTMTEFKETAQLSTAKDVKAALQLIAQENGMGAAPLSSGKLVANAASTYKDAFPNATIESQLKVIADEGGVKSWLEGVNPGSQKAWADKLSLKVDELQPFFEQLVSENTPGLLTVPEAPVVAPVVPGTTPIPMAEPLPFDVAELKPAPASEQISAGMHSKTIYTGPDGKLWMFKESVSTPSQAYADELAGTLRSALGMDSTPTYTTVIDGKFGSLQQLYGDSAQRRDMFKAAFDPGRLKAEQTATLQEDQVFDWLIGNHDAHAEQFIRLSGSMNPVETDFGQAFKFFGNDKLDYAYHPNPSQSVYNIMDRAYAEGRSVPGYQSLAKDSGNKALTDFIQRVQSMSDEQYRTILRPYAEQSFERGTLAGRDVNSFLDAAVERKNTIQQTFTDYQTRLESERAAARQAMYGDLKPAEDFTDFTSYDKAQEWGAQVSYKSYGRELSQANRDAYDEVRRYTSSSDINGYLRGARSRDPAAVAHRAANMDAAMAYKPLPEDVVAHRAANNVELNAIKKQVGADLVGGTYTDSGYLSTSLGPRSAFGTGELNLTVQIPAGTPGAYVNYVSSHTTEYEVILGRNLQYKIIEYADLGNGRTKLVVQVIGGA